MNFGFKEEMGFEVDQVKTLFVSKPRLWMMSMSYISIGLHRLSLECISIVKDCHT